MQLSKKKISRNLKKQVYAFFYQAVADIKDPKEAEVFLKDILSKTELSAIAKRLMTAYLLKKGKNYRQIKNSLRVSSTTISSISEQIAKGEGFKIALKKIEADEWAEKWSKKIKKMFSVS